MMQNQTDQSAQANEVEEAIRNDPAFEIISVNTCTGETIVSIQKGIIGATANQLKTTSDKRKGASIVRKLGHVLSDCGDIQYGRNVEDTDIDPSLVTDVDYEDDIHMDNAIIATNEKE